MLNYILWYLSKERPDLIHFNIVVEPNNGTVYTVGMLQGEHANYIQKPDGIYTPTVSLAQSSVSAAASDAESQHCHPAGSKASCGTSI